MAASVSLWISLIVLAVGLVFTFGQSGLRGGAPMTGAQAAAVVMPGPTATPVEEPTPTATPTAVAAPPTVAVDTPTSEPTNTFTPEPTPTLEPTPTPTLHTGPPTRLVIPAIQLDTPVITVNWHEEVIDGVRLAVWDVADYAAGWHSTSSQPGQGENIVISGHHNIKGEVFRDLVTLEPGAEITLYVDETPYYYHVVDKLILPEKGMPLDVRRENALWIAAVGEERLTLVTCWPYENNTHRVIVVAKPDL